MMIASLSAIAIILVTLFALTSHIAWNPYLELTAHFKLQYLVICLLLLIPLLFSYAKPWLFISFVCIAIQLVEILPWYIPPAWIGTSNSPNLRVLLSNVYVRNQQYEDVLALVKQENPDIAIFQEVDATWATQLQPLKSSYPYTFEEPDTTLYSRSPLNDVSVFGVAVKRSIAVSLRVNNQDIRLVATHPLPPAPWLAKLRNEQLNQIAHYIKQQRSPIILIGDLNVTLWSPYYKKLIQETGLKNSRQGFGILPTWPAPTQYASTHPILAFFKPLLWIPLDHCLISPNIKVTNIRTGRSIQSDHLPLIIDLLIS